jgi:hypothetical protein
MRFVIFLINCCPFASLSDHVDRATYLFGATTQYGCQYLNYLTGRAMNDAALAVLTNAVLVKRDSEGKVCAA